MERAGKGYGLVLTTLRKSIGPQTANKSIYVLENYGLRNMGKEAGAEYSQFISPLVEEGMDSAHKLARGSLIAMDVPGIDAEDDDELSEVGEEDDATTHVSWYLPMGCRVAPKPIAIDKECVGALVFLNWKEYGWQLGKIADIITSSTPRLVKNFNVRVTWADGRGPAMLDLNMYQHGEEAPVDSWVLLHERNAIGGSSSEVQDFPDNNSEGED